MRSLIFARPYTGNKKTENPSPATVLNILSRLRDRSGGGRAVKTLGSAQGRLMASAAFAPVFVLLLAVTIAVQLICGGVARGAEFSDGMLPLVTDQVKEETALEPYLGYFVDRHGRLTLEEILSPSYQNRFIRLSDGLPPTTVGALWLRLTLVSTVGKLPHALAVNLGPNLPQDRYRVYIPEAAEPHFLGRLATNWKSLELDGSPSFMLPDVESQPVTIYIRLEGVPHLWFAPVVNIEGAQTNNNSNVQLFILGITALAAIIAFARGIFQDSNEKIWCGVYSVILLLQIYMPVVSTAKGIIALPTAPFVLAPGLALLILPQLGRIRMGTEGYAPRSDLILRVSTWLGAVLALLPLVPGLAWVARYLMLWPVLCLPLFLTTVLCLIIGLEGAFGYFLCAALSMAGALVAVFFAGSQFPPFWVSSAPLLGLALGALALALANCPSSNRRHPFKKTIPDSLNRTDGSSDRAGLSVLESTGRNGNKGSALSLAGENETGDNFYNGSFDSFLNTPFPETGNDNTLQTSTLAQPTKTLGQILGHTPLQMSEEIFAKNSGQIPGQAYSAYQFNNDARISEPIGQTVAGALKTLQPGAEAEPTPYGDTPRPGNESSFLGLSLHGEPENDLLRPYTAESHLREREPELFPYDGALDNFSDNSGGTSAENGLKDEFVVSMATHEFYQPQSDSHDINQDDQEFLPGFTHPQPPAFDDHAKSGAARSEHTEFYDEPIYIEEPNPYQSGYANQPHPPATPYWREPEAKNTANAAETIPEPFFERPALDKYLPYENISNGNTLGEKALGEHSPEAFSTADVATANSVPFTSSPAQSEKRIQQDYTPPSPPRLTLNLNLSTQTIPAPKPAPNSPDTSSPAPQADELRPDPEETSGWHASALQPVGPLDAPAAPPTGRHLGLITDDDFTDLSPAQVIPPVLAPALAMEAQTPPAGEVTLKESSLEIMPGKLYLHENPPTPLAQPELLPSPPTPTMVGYGENVEPETPEAPASPMQPHVSVSSGLTQHSLQAPLAPRPLTPEDEDLLLPKVLLPPKAVEAFSGPLSELLRNLAALSSCSLAPMAKAHAESAAKNGEALMAVAKRFGIAQPQNENVGKDDKRPFDIYKMLNELHEENLPTAQQKSLGLSWFASPRLSHRFEGDGARLKSILAALLKDSIKASSKGNVQFSARLTADSTDPGMVTFTISDSRPFSSRYDPSANQASLEAIKFADAMGGTFNTSNNQNNGTVVSFSAHFNPLNTTQRSLADSKANAVKEVKADESSFAEAVEQVINLKKPVKPVYTPTHISNNVLVLDMAVGTRRQLLNLLDQLGIKGREVRFAPEAIDSYAQDPTPLVTVNADMPESDLASFISSLKKLEQQNNLGPVRVLAIAGNAAQSQRLLALGCNQVTLKPLTLDNIREAIASLSPELLSRTAAEEHPDLMQTDASVEQALPQPAEHMDYAVHAAGADSSAPAGYVPVPSVSPVTVDDIAEDPASVSPVETLVETLVETASKKPGPTDFTGLTGSIETAAKTPDEFSGTPESGSQSETGNTRNSGLPDEAGISAEKAASLEYINSIMANPVIPDKNSVLSLNSLPVTEIRPRPKPPVLQEQMVRLIPVPGLDYEGIEPELVPLLPGFLADVGEALLHASQARDRQSTIDVQEAVTRLAGKAQSFGLSKLEGIAACVGRAAAADDIAAVSDLMLELDNTTAKHIEALQNFYDAERSKPSS